MALAMSDERCPSCDRVGCPAADVEHNETCMNGADGYSYVAGCPRCDADRECDLHAVDWHARCLAAEEVSERRRVEREAALSVSTTDGMTPSEWTLRTGLAERERGDLRARVAELEAALGEACDEFEYAGRPLSAENEACIEQWRALAKGGRR